MYGFRDDKSKWNLGQWAMQYVSPTSGTLKAGLEWDDNVIIATFPDKYVAKVTPVPQLLQTLGEYPNPSLIWEVINSSGTKELNERQQEDAAKIIDVFFQNQNIYVILKQKLKDDIYLLIKGA